MQNKLNLIADGLQKQKPHQVPLLLAENEKLRL